jgi:thymidine kinase
MAKLYFYYSAMNAGKTTTLLQSSYNYHERGMDTLLFTPIIDDRFGSGKIASRIGLTKDAISFDPSFNFFDYIEEIQKTLPKLKCILIDEAQFMVKEQVLQLTQVVDRLKLPVLTYGLRTDFLGEAFEGSRYLL